MIRHYQLYTPGPGDVDEDVLEAMAQPVLRHYGPEWMEVHHEITQLLQTIFKTKNDIFMVPGPASALLDMAIGSTVPSGEKIIVGNNGFFGQRLIDIAKGYSLEVVPFTAPLGAPLDPQALADLLRQHPDARAVALVHHETSTTVLNPLGEIAAASRQAGKPLIVDAVASLGGVDLPVDEWGVDICVTAANKCLEALPGIGFISVSPRAWEAVDSHPGAGHGWYLNLRTWRQYAQEWGAWHPSPVTLPVNTILAVKTSMEKIVAGGLEKHYDKYVHASQWTRGALYKLGFKMFVPDKYAAPIVTGVRARPEFTVKEFSQWLERECGMAIGGGLGELAGKMFRVGHLGKASTHEYISGFLHAVEAFLHQKHLPLPWYEMEDIN